MYRKNPLNSSLRPNGFTLIELLITVSIFSVVSIAIYATFNSGMTVWRRAKETNAQDRQFLLKIEKLSRELRQAFNYNDIVFTAGKDRIQFPSIIDSDICRIIYSFDGSKKIIFRSSEKLADILKTEKAGLEPESSAYFSGVDNLSFSYLAFDMLKKTYIWQEDWKQDNLPIAVKISITTKAKTYATTIVIPTA
jgi:prepilin-type N-terminal cleavage/methylation domain-containing protein